MFSMTRELSSVFNATAGRPVRLAPRPDIKAYALPVRQGTMAQSPREVLGVEADADATTIKTAFRRLALKYHPDRQGDERRFVEIVRAYEILIGKSDGKDHSLEADWDFHDWYWKFTMHRSKHRASSPSAAFQADLPSQLAGLRERAAIRRTKAKFDQGRDYSAAIDCSDGEDYEECPSDSGPITDDVDSEARSVEEARRRATLESEESKAGVRHQLTGLRRRSQIRSTL